MNKFPGLGDRMRARLKALGYWRQNRPDILRFCAERDYRPQYVYAWLKDRVPTYANLRRLARDLDAPIAWLVFGREAESAAVLEAGPRSAPTAPAQVIDLPRLREVTEKLVQLEGDLAGIFQAFPDGYFWLDADGTLLSHRTGPGFESPALPADIVGRRLREVFAFDVAKTLEQALDEALRTGGLVAREYTQAHADMVRAYEARFVPLAGRLPRERRVLVIVREITERRRAEQWTHKLALENAALYAEAERRRRAAEVIAALARDINASLDLDTVLQRAVEGAREICQADAAWIALPEPGSETMTLRCRTGIELPAQQRPVEPGAGAAGEVLVSGRPVRTGGAAEPDPAQQERAVAELVVPIRLAERVAGLIHVARRSDRPFGDGDEAILVALADHAAIAIRNARLFAEAERRRQTAERLAETGRLLAASRDPTLVADRIVRSVLTVFDALACAVYRMDPATGDLVVVAWAGSYGDDSPTFLPRGMGVSGLAASQGVPMYSPDCLADPRIAYRPEDRAVVEQARFRAVLSVPLVVQDRVIGSLGLGDVAGRRFDDEAVRTLQAFADQAAVALADAWQISVPARSG